MWLCPGFALGQVGILNQAYACFDKTGRCPASEMIELKQNSGCPAKFAIELQPEPVFVGFEHDKRSKSPRGLVV